MSKAAAIQMCSSNNLEENLNIAAQLITEAANNGATLAVLPEMFALMGLQLADALSIKETYGSGKIQDFLAEQALRNNIWIVGGTIPIDNTKNKVGAACLVYNNKGLVVARYDKVHLFDVIVSETESYRESAVMEPGDKLVVVDTPIGKLGLAVCYDLRFPTLFNYLLHQGAEIFAIPTAFTMTTGKAHWHLLTRSRAVENLCYVIGACQYGTHASGRQTYGHSLMIEPWGSIIQELAEPRAGVIYADIDLTYLRKLRASLPIKEHQKILLDLSKLTMR